LLMACEADSCSVTVCMEAWIEETAMATRIESGHITRELRLVMMYWLSNSLPTWATVLAASWRILMLLLM
jgi:hypothetical protein